MGLPVAPGFEGVETFARSLDTNGSVSLGIVNAYEVSVPKSSVTPTFSACLISAFLGLAAAFVLLGKAIRRHERQTTMSKGEIPAEVQRTLCVARITIVLDSIRTLSNDTPWPIDEKGAGVTELRPLPRRHGGWEYPREVAADERDFVHSDRKKEA